MRLLLVIGTIFLAVVSTSTFAEAWSDTPSEPKKPVKKTKRIPSGQEVQNKRERKTEVFVNAPARIYYLRRCKGGVLDLKKMSQADAKWHGFKLEKCPVNGH